MKKLLRNAFFFFFVLMSLSITMLVIAEAKADKNVVVTPKTSMSIPSEEENLLNSLLSAVGGFGGGGILLLFLIRRLVNSYDANFEKLQKNIETNERIQCEQNEKLLQMVEDVRVISNSLRLEVMKIQVNSADKDNLTEALTRVTMLEVNIKQVQGEVRDILSRIRTG